MAIPEVVTDTVAVNLLGHGCIGFFSVWNALAFFIVRKIYPIAMLVVFAFRPLVTTFMPEV